MFRRVAPVLVSAILLQLTSVAAVAGQRANNHSTFARMYSGDPVAIGAGFVQAYARVDERGRPIAVGVRFPASALRDLPTDPHDGERCWDRDEDGSIDLASECAGGHERILTLPEAALEETDSPFRWVLVNWNPIGHGPPDHPWAVPHFDSRRSRHGQSPGGHARARIPRFAVYAYVRVRLLGRPHHLLRAHDHAGVVPIPGGRFR